MEMGSPENGPCGSASDWLSADFKVSVEIAFRLDSWS